MTFTGRVKTNFMKRLLIILLAFLLFAPVDANSQRKRNQKDNSKKEN